MFVSDGVATYAGPTTAATTAAAPPRPRVTPASPAAPAARATPAIAVTPASAVPGRHAGSGRPVDRRRLLPLAVLFAGLAVIALMTFGLVQTMDGTGTSATRANGAANGSATPPAAASGTATVGSVLLPPGSSAAAGASASASASPSASVSGSASASASASATAAASASPSMSPSAVTSTSAALTPLPDPAADPVGYVQGLRNQVQELIGQGPATLQPDAGQNLLNSLAGLQNLVVAAQQHPGSKQWRDVANRITAVQQQVSNDAAAGQISDSAANTLVSELQRLADSLPGSNSNTNGNGSANGT